MDALNRPRAIKFGRKEKQEYAIKKQESEIKAFLDDKEKVKKTAKSFEDHVKRERRILGLE